MRTLIVVCLVLCCVLSGCATSNMKTTKKFADGTEISYQVKIDSLFQDFKGSDLSASLNPEGKTTVKAGAIQNDTSQVAADVAKQFVELFKLMLPLLQQTSIPAIPTE